MKKLTGKLGVWNLPHVHAWHERGREIAFERTPIINSGTRIATIGSCFASEIAGALGRLGLRGGMHPTGLFYTTRSIRQEIERIFGGWPAYRDEPVWTTRGGFVHPFKDYKTSWPTRDALRTWSDDLDRRGDAMFREADVVVITLGLIEAWTSRATGNHFRQIPHPDVFDQLEPVFRRLTTEEMKQDLRVIRDTLCANTSARIIVTVSPVPLHATVTASDVRIANTESKHRIRAAVSEFIESYPDVHYFHSYEIVTAAERMSDFMLDDGRHVSRQGVDYIVGQFMAQFADASVPRPVSDGSWITAPAKTAIRPQAAPLPLWARLGSRVRNRLRLRRS